MLWKWSQTLMAPCVLGLISVYILDLNDDSRITLTVGCPLPIYVKRKAHHLPGDTRMRGKDLLRLHSSAHSDKFYLSIWRNLVFESIRPTVYTSSLVWREIAWTGWDMLPRGIPVSWWDENVLLWYIDCVEGVWERAGAGSLSDSHCYFKAEDKFPLWKPVLCTGKKKEYPYPSRAQQNVVQAFLELVLIF